MQSSSVLKDRRKIAEMLGKRKSLKSYAKRNLLR
jgi:hypothetical protein